MGDREAMEGDQRFEQDHDDRAPCRACRGTGHVGRVQCPDCRGEGRL